MARTSTRAARSAPSGGRDAQVVAIGDRRLRLTHLDKIIYPETGTTKREVLEYYTAVAPFMLPHTAFRPATRKRWVDGVGTASAPLEPFFEKNLPDSTPAWVPRGHVQHTSRVAQYPLVNDLATLIWCAQLGALELHVPQWQLDETGKQGNPDRLVLDLDPGEGAGLAECSEVALLVRGILRGMGLDALPVTSGSKGIHLYAHVDRKYTSAQLSDVAKEIARALEADHRDLIVSDMKKTLRRGKVLIDWSQNNAKKTTIAPYSLRGRARPTVAAPRSWKEIEQPGLEHLDFRQVLERLDRQGDLLLGLIDTETGERMSRPAAASALDAYRAKRDASRTPEPVPPPGQAAVSGTTAAAAEGQLFTADDGSIVPPPADAAGRFVIQDHYATRHHHDFRLERDGVLVSWAVPRLTPEDPARNHLAVQTEDHPLEYGDFAGTIPKGEYGAGTVTIWDAGTYELEKWRDDEVLVTLHGREGGGVGGTARFALIRTKGEGEKSQWLIHRRKPDAGGAGRPRSRAAAIVAPSHASTTTEPVAAERTDPHRYSTMLALAGTRADLRDGDWSVEMKWDGIRALVTVDGDAVTLVSRNHRDLTSQYPELAAIAQGVRSSSAVIDGEIVALDSRGRPSFGRLQQRMNRTKPGEIRAAARAVPVRFYAFDLLERDGLPLVGRDYRARRQALGETITPVDGVLDVPPAFDGDVDAALNAASALDLEGVVAKRVGSDYEQGRRSGAWTKIKFHSTQEVVIGGWRPGRGERKGSLGSLLVAVPEGDALRYAGRVGTGFDTASRAALLRMLEPLQRAKPAITGVPDADAADAVWVSPQLVGEVSFTEWTDTRRLRHPVWRGLRADKRPDQIIEEHAGV
ncbi:ATP-dependent DNA ligase [Ruicaihuangia caeni]|uniref:ATP-dependent DNA ligase n=1 Tax=Ruicaihuangia caeni TaxID=3042517 RepID=UPI00338DC011